MYHKFRHDYYSKTYPRYESYSDVENKRDLVDLIETIHNNEMVDFKTTMYHNPDGTINEYFKSSVASVVSNSISTELSAPIIQQVTMILSSPEASVALEAPVVNLIASSTQVQAQTVNVMSAAFIDNRLSDAMVSSFSNTMKDERILEPMKETTISVLQTKEVSVVVTNTVGTALSSNELSSHLTPAVDTVLSTDQVAETAANVVAPRIDIEKIFGQRDAPESTDENKNGVPDEYEKTNDNESYDVPIPKNATIVIGNLGT